MFQDKSVLMIKYFIRRILLIIISFFNTLSTKKWQKLNVAKIYIIYLVMYIYINYCLYSMVIHIL